jgi:hypothetical protein
MTTWAIGGAAAADTPDDYDAIAGVNVRADDVAASLGAGLALGTGTATELPTCMPADDGNGDGNGTGNGSGDGTGNGDGSGDGTGNGDGTGDGNGDGNGDGTGDGTGNGSSNGGSLIDLDVWGDTDGLLDVTHGRNLLDASVLTSTNNLVGSHKLTDGSADVVVGNYPAGHNSLITVDGMVLFD